MATEQILYKPTGFVAASDLSLKQYMAMKVSAAGKVDTLTGAAGTAMYAVLQNDPKADQAAELCRLGRTPALSGAAVAVNDPIAVDAAGKFITAVGAGTEVVGRALTAAAGADELFELDVLPEDSI